MAKKKTKINLQWDTQKILQDLKETLNNVKEISSLGQGGNYDTDQISITFTNTKDRLFVKGFVCPNVRKIITPSQTEIDMIELTDGMDSNGGLNSSDINLAHQYIYVRQYFIDSGFSVVNSMSEFW